MGGTELPAPAPAMRIISELSPETSKSTVPPLWMTSGVPDYIHIPNFKAVHISLEMSTSELREAPADVPGF